MRPVNVFNLFYKAICASSFLICLIWGCARTTEVQQSINASIYTLCLKDILNESLLKSDSSLKDLLLTNRLNSNYGITSELYLNDDAVKDLIDEDSTWKDFIKQIDIQNVLNDTSSQQPDFIPNETSLILTNINIVTVATNDSIIQNPQSFWHLHRDKFPNSIGIICLSRILYSIDKRKAMLTIELLTGRLSGVRMLYLVSIEPKIRIKFKSELEVM
jgi:hypothetical protein